jgi:hypothetical protein
MFGSELLGSLRTLKILAQGLYFSLQVFKISMGHVEARDLLCKLGLLDLHHLHFFL